MAGGHGCGKPVNMRAWWRIGLPQIRSASTSTSPKIAAAYGQGDDSGQARSDASSPLPDPIVFDGRQNHMSHTPGRHHSTTTVLLEHSKDAYV
jgi:hypothetical protein